MKNIVFWKWHLGLDKIANHFDSGLMSNKEKFRYFFLFVLLFLAGTQLASITFVRPDEPNIMEISSVAIGMVVVLGGFYYLYKQHTEASSFMEKFIILYITAIPYMIVCIALPLFIFLYPTLLYIFGAGADSDISIFSWPELIIGALLEIAIFLKLSTYFK